MAFLRKNKKKVSQRTKGVIESMSEEKLSTLADVVNSGLPNAILMGITFAAFVTTLLAFDVQGEDFGWKGWNDILALGGLSIMITAGMGWYIHHYQRKILENITRESAVSGLMLILLLLTKIGGLSDEWVYLAVGTSITGAIIFTITYNQRFALGMGIFYSLFACMAVDWAGGMGLFITMLGGVLTCCFLLREIRTRMKLVEVTSMAAVVVFVISALMGVLNKVEPLTISTQSGAAALATFFVGIVIQAFLPIIEKVFGIVTSMTLLDYSDANQPLLKKLAMEAPGTFSHSLQIGSIAEAAAESIGANGLLCRVGAYYHDIGKINKPPYFVENQMGSSSRHSQLSPAMSQLVIVGHVKDGIEIAKEFGLPAALRQFIETHHGTTLIQYFYEEAKRKRSERDAPVSESEFRYPGPKPQTKEAAIVMLSDTVESASRAMSDATPTKIETLIHTLAMRRLQDGQFDECDLTLRELHKIEEALSKAVAAHHHGRIAYPEPQDEKKNKHENGKAKDNSSVEAFTEHENKIPDQKDTIIDAETSSDTSD